MEKKHFKKAFICLIAALLAMVLPATQLGAAEANIAGGTAVTVPAGSARFSFDVTLKGPSEAFASLQFYVSYDRDSLTLDGFTVNPALSSQLERFETTDGGAQVTSLAFSGGSNKVQLDSSEIRLATLSFAIKGASASSELRTSIRVYNMRMIEVYQVTLDVGGKKVYDFRTDSEPVSGDLSVAVTRAAAGSEAPTSDQTTSTPPGGSISDGGNDTTTTTTTTNQSSNDDDDNGDDGDDGNGGVDLPEGATTGPDGSISIPRGSGGATITLPDGRTLDVPGGYVMIPDASQPFGYAIVFDNPFIDVHESDWFYGDVEYVYVNELFNGTSATEFSPGIDVTRGMLITVIGRLSGVRQADYQGESFEDVAAGAYYAPYVKWGMENGVVLGVGENRYEPDRAIKREELVTILSRYAGLSGGVSLPQERELIAFADEDEISGYAKEAVAEMYRAGIINGRAEGVIAPTDTATRAEMAAMIHRFALAIGWTR
ncbi:MAG: S-layer homology domain-containing protein [Clostridiales bacterium]|jgi:hypothetical protein|nr:S-layer homology domain-containing protein [Clostridiales bacterium]